MMKVLIAHNDYGKYSGEEAVVDKMGAMLEERGIATAQLRMSTAGARESLTGKIRGFASGIYCPQGIRAMREALRREQPDVVNVHNLYPFISPAALRECRKAGVPVVMTIHNYRLICPTGLFMRDGKPCELCLRRSDEWGCVRHNCEHSILKSTGYALRNMVARRRRHYMDCVDVFACITDFQRRKLTEAGFPPEKLTVIPNSLDIPATGAASPSRPGEYVAFSGRISREKGVDLIIEAARRNPDIEFRLAGAVRDRELVEQLPPNVKPEGHLSGEALTDFYRNARFFVMASRCYEGFSMTILEAALHSKPMIAPDHGGFTEITGRGDDAIGILTPPGDADALSRAIRNLYDDPGECRRLGEAARHRLETRYSTRVTGDAWAQLLKNLAYR